MSFILESDKLKRLFIYVCSRRGSLTLTYVQSGRQTSSVNFSINLKSPISLDFQVFLMSLVLLEWKVLSKNKTLGKLDTQKALASLSKS